MRLNRPRTSKSNLKQWERCAVNWDNVLGNQNRGAQAIRKIEVVTDPLDEQVEHTKESSWKVPCNTFAVPSRLTAPRYGEQHAQKEETFSKKCKWCIFTANWLAGWSVQTAAVDGVAFTTVSYDKMRPWRATRNNFLFYMHEGQTLRNWVWSGTAT